VGPGTNRVIEECERWGIDSPRFEEVTGALGMTFPASHRTSHRTSTSPPAETAPRSSAWLSYLTALDQAEHAPAAGGEQSLGVVIGGFP